MVTAKKGCSTRAVILAGGGGENGPVIVATQLYSSFASVALHLKG